MNRNQKNVFETIAIQSKHEGICNSTTVTCTVIYKNNEWIFTVPGEKSVAIRDSMQARTIIDMFINKGSSMEPDDIEYAASMGQIVVHGNPHATDKTQSHYGAEESDLSEEDDDVMPEVSENASCDENEDKHDVNLALEKKFISGSDPDLLMLYGFSQPRHTGDACDFRLIRDLDCRVATLDVGIEAARARGYEKKAAALCDEKIALRKWRNFYANSMSGRLRPFYSPEADEKAHRCRMRIVRGLQGLAAKGLTKSVASLDAAISRGMKFQYDEQPGYEWVVTLPPHGSLPVLGKPRGDQHGGSKVAA